MPPLCLTLAEISLSSLEQKILDYNGVVGVIELRLDYLANPDMPNLPEESPTQFLATCRPRREGGGFDGLEGDRLDILRAAARAGCGLLDVEHDVDEDLGDLHGVTIVRSYHSFESFPDDLDSLEESLARRSEEIPKMAVRVSKTAELVKLLNWMESRDHTKPRIVIGMGSAGQVSRLLGGFLGNGWTYVVESGENAVAPGQFGLDEAKNLYRLDSWNEIPDLFGVFGEKQLREDTLVLCNQMFKRYHANALCLPLELDELAPWFEFVKRSSLPFKGFGAIRKDESEEAGIADLASEYGVNLVPSGGGLAEKLALQFGEWAGIKPERDSLLGLIRRS